MYIYIYVTMGMCVAVWPHCRSGCHDTYLSQNTGQLCAYSFQDYPHGKLTQEFLNHYHLFPLLSLFIIIITIIIITLYFISSSSSTLNDIILIITDITYLYHCTVSRAVCHIITTIITITDITFLHQSTVRQSC